MSFYKPYPSDAPDWVHPFVGQLQLACASFQRKISRTRHRRKGSFSIVIMTPAHTVEKVKENQIWALNTSTNNKGVPCSKPLVCFALKLAIPFCNYLLDRGYTTHCCPWNPKKCVIIGFAGSFTVYWFHIQWPPGVHTVYWKCAKFI